MEEFRTDERDETAETETSLALSYLPKTKERSPLDSLLLARGY